MFSWSWLSLCISDGRGRQVPGVAEGDVIPDKSIHYVHYIYSFQSHFSSQNETQTQKDGWGLGGCWVGVEWGLGGGWMLGWVS